MYNTHIRFLIPSSHIEMSTHEMSTHESTHEMSTHESTHEMNLYYGIYCSSTYGRFIKWHLEESEKYAEVLTDDGIMIGADNIYTTYNADENPTMYMICSDEMIHASTEQDTNRTYCEVDPSKMHASEAAHQDSVLFLTDLFSYLVTCFRKEKTSPRVLHLGWFVTNCTWDNTSESSSGSSSEELSEEEVVPAMNIRAVRDKKPSNETAENIPSNDNAAASKKKGKPKATSKNAPEDRAVSLIKIPAKKHPSATKKERGSR